MKFRLSGRLQLNFRWALAPILLAAAVTIRSIHNWFLLRSGDLIKVYYGAENIRKNLTVMFKGAKTSLINTPVSLSLSGQRATVLSADSINHALNYHD